MTYNIFCTETVDAKGLPPLCNFESNICGYSQDTTDQFDWTLSSNTNVGPAADRTLKTAAGRYKFSHNNYFMINKILIYITSRYKNCFYNLLNMFIRLISLELSPF